jgi:branched-chain amino acid transport system substrate-binding protein
MRAKRLPWSVPMSLMLLGLSAAPAPAADQVTLTIGLLQEATGPMSPSAPAMEKTAKLAIQAANDAAKQAGAPLAVQSIAADTQGDPQAALSAARSLIEKGATCLVGPSTTPESLAIANGLTIRRKVTLWPTASSTRMRTVDDAGTIFRTVPPDDRQAVAVAEAISLTLGGASGKTVSVAYRNEPYGEGLAKNFISVWESKGGKVQGPVVYDPNQATFDSEAQSIVANAPAAYFIVDYPDSWVKMGAALLRAEGYDSKKLFVSDAMAFTEVPANIPTASLEGAKGTRAGTPTETPSYKAFDALWQKAGGTEHYSLDANQFDATMMCVLAAAAAKSNDPAAMQAEFRKVSGPPGKQYDFLQLADALKALGAGEDIDYQGVSGPLDLDAKGDPTTSVYDIFEYHDGRLKVVRQVDAKL